LFSLKDIIMLPKKKYQVFVCSTFKDLQIERQAVFAAIHKQGHIPIGMEGFTPGNMGQLEYIRDRIDECDFFIIIVAHRFGTKVPDPTANKSVTQYEYDYAINHPNKIPISRFIIDTKAPWTGERSEGHEKIILDEFKNDLSKKGDNDFFDINPWMDANDLGLKVISSLEAMIKQTSRPGLVKPSAAYEDAINIGIDRIFRGLRREDKKEILSAGHKQLRIVMNDGYNFFKHNDEHIRKALDQGTRIDILLVHPDSPCLGVIADKSDKSVERQRLDIIDGIKYLSDNFKSNPLVRVIGHKQYNTYSAIINEKFCFIDFYFNYHLVEGRQDDRVALRCSATDDNNALFYKINDDFENFWRTVERETDSNLFKMAF
jgi:hypothetical protein